MAVPVVVIDELYEVLEHKYTKEQLDTIMWFQLSFFQKEMNSGRNNNIFLPNFIEAHINDFKRKKYGYQPTGSKYRAKYKYQTGTTSSTVEQEAEEESNCESEEEL